MEIYLVAIEEEEQCEGENSFKEHLNFTFKEEAEEWDESPRGNDLEEPECNPFIGLLTTEESCQKGDSIADKEDNRADEYQCDHVKVIISL